MKMAISKLSLAIFAFVIIALCFDSSSAQTSQCGDWESFRDEHCYKLFDKAGLQSYDEAEKMCTMNGGTILSIHSKEEQEFVANFLFQKSHAVDGVWLGAKYGVVNKFKWTDGSDLTYTNWATGSPKNLADYCVQMHSEVALLGKWIDEPCAKKNLVVCRKDQVWSIVRMQEIVQEMRILQTNYLARIRVLEQGTSIPVGFTYVQLPHEKAPGEIWPGLVWSDVSASYAGTFFRVEGSTSGKFGEIQAETSPHLTGVERHACTNAVDLIRFSGKGGWSPLVVTSRPQAGSYCDALRFEISADEVRPKNMAMRVWKRTA